jgi:hypothetical protein
VPALVIIRSRQLETIGADDSDHRVSIRSFERKHRYAIHLDFLLATTISPHMLQAPSCITILLMPSNEIALCEARYYSKQAQAIYCLTHRVCFGLMSDLSKELTEPT